VVASRRPAQGLGECEALHEAERLMMELSGGAGGELLGGIAREHLRTGGKRLRARLSLAALEAFGEPRSDGVGWAAACELLHNATLVHDDLQDGDRTRRGQPTVWARHGAAQAINTGDLLLMLPFLALDRLRVDAEVRWQLTRLLAECATRVAGGQALELGLRPADEVDWPTYRAVVAGKTGALFQLPVEGGALLSGRGPAASQAIGLEFQRLGVLFQLQDDVLDLYGDKGREVAGSDLREGKLTALVIEHLQRTPGDRAWLLRLLAMSRDHTPERGVREAIHRFRAHGALAAVRGRIAAEAEAIAASPVLLREPALRMLAVELVREVLKPIEHLFDPAPDLCGEEDLRLASGACVEEVA
jgi:geranylgeranyl diphosphate synthase, type I